MPDDLLLTVGIPIYNGDRYLAETLDSILPQVEVLQDKVEFFILDNASTDRTPEICREYISRYPFIRYLRNETNIGYDRNYDLLINLSRGKYVWTFCDDDIIRSWGVQKVIKVLEKFPDLSNIYVNYAVYDGLIKSCKDVRAIKIFYDRLCRTPDQFYLCSQNGTVAASSNIYRRDFWVKLEKDEFFELKWVQVWGLSKLMSQNFSYPSYCIAEPIWILRQDPKWIKGGGLFLLTLNLLPIFQRLEDLGYSKKTQELMVGFIENNFLGIIISSKIDGLKVNWVLIKRIYSLTRKFSYTYSAYFLLIIPNFAYFVVFKLIMALKSVKNQ